MSEWDGMTGQQVFEEITKQFDAQKTNTDNIKNRLDKFNKSSDTIENTIKSIQNNIQINENRLNDFNKQNGVSIEDTINSINAELGKKVPINQTTHQIDSQYLPSYIDDIVEGYYNSDKNEFYYDDTKKNKITPDKGKIYVDLTDSLKDSYRYSGSVYIKIVNGDEIQNRLDNFSIEEGKNEGRIEDVIKDIKTDIQDNADRLNNFDGQEKVSIETVIKGKANLDETGKVPAEQLPSYIDDVIEGYYENNAFYGMPGVADTKITGERGKIYVDLSTNRIYRWSPARFIYIEIGNRDEIQNRLDNFNVSDKTENSIEKTIEKKADSERFDKYCGQENKSIEEVLGIGHELPMNVGANCLYLLVEAQDHGGTPAGLYVSKMDYATGTPVLKWQRVGGLL